MIRFRPPSERFLQQGCFIFHTITGVNKYIFSFSLAVFANTGRLRWNKHGKAEQLEEGSDFWSAFYFGRLIPIHQIMPSCSSGSTAVFADIKLLSRYSALMAIRIKAWEKCVGVMGRTGHSKLRNSQLTLQLFWHKPGGGKLKTSIKPLSERTLSSVQPNRTCWNTQLTPPPPTLFL